MTTAHRETPRFFRPLGLAIAGLLVVTGCAMEPEELPVTGAIIIGTNDEIGTLDPAGAADRGALLVMSNVYPQLLTTIADASEPVPNIAVSAEFTSPTEYTVTLKPSLTFANGNSLTSSDVKFSFDRLTEIDAEGGPAALFSAMSKIETPDDTTVVFTLSNANDELWPIILSSPPAAIVDEEVFSKSELTSNRDIVKGQGFGGQYVIESFRELDLIRFAANSNYGGVLDAPATDTINLRYYGNAANLARAVRAGDVDLATRGFGAENLRSVAGDDELVVHSVPGGEVRFLAVDPAAGPFGTATPDRDAAKALVVRQALADLIDRNALASELYEGAYEPLFSFAPASVHEGAELASLYGAADGAPDTMRATRRFQEAGITPPVALNVHYSTASFGPLAAEELTAIASQLSQGGLFTVELIAEDAEEKEEGATASSSSSAFPVFAGSYIPTVFDAESYLDAFVGAQSVLGTQFGSAPVQALIAAPTGGDSGETRSRVISQAMELLASEVPIIPVLQSNHVLVANAGLTGVEDARAGSFVLRFSFLSK